MPRLRITSIIRLVIIAAALYAVYRFRESWVPTVSKQIPGSIPHPPLPKLPSRLGGTTIDRPPDINYTSELFDPSLPCAQLPGGQDILLLVKTGATEIYRKLPVHLVTTLRCVPNVMIFSDHEQSLSEFPVYDAIKHVSKNLVDKHADFRLYRKLRDSVPMGGQELVKSTKEEESWKLDKWKFLPMLHSAFEAARPNIKWFVVVEADTSLSWHNLLHFLQQHDPKKPFYGGAQLSRGKLSFAHGGSGIVISRKAADILSKLRQNKGQAQYDAKWETQTSNTCCGDEIVGAAFLEAGVNLSPSWPFLQGETPHSLDWGPGIWCLPPVSWHHASATEVNALWQFEDAWLRSHNDSSSGPAAAAASPPFLFRDVFEKFVAPYILPKPRSTTNANPIRSKWNNLSADRKFVHPNVAKGEVVDFDSLRDYEKAAVASPEACEKACITAGEAECVQWLFTTGRCQLGKVVRFGSAESRDDLVWTSGWIAGRVRAMREKARECEVRWKL